MRYWGVAFDTDWQAGSTMTMELDKDAVKIADPAQVVLESEPGRRLSYTWHTFTPEWAAAFADHVWRPGLEPLRALARIRIVHCTVAADVAFGRITRRGQDSPLRRVHADPRDQAEHEAAHRAFDQVGLDVPALEVDTSDGYHPRSVPLCPLSPDGTENHDPERAWFSRPGTLTHSVAASHAASVRAF